MGVRRGAALLVLVLAAGGCGAEADRPKVASATGQGRSSESRTATTAKPTVAGDDVAEYIDAMRRWAACIRKEGVEVSDPDPKGIVTFPDGTGSSKTEAAVVAAQAACSAILPTVPEAVMRLRLPPLTPEQIEVKRRYADCMQRSGAPDFPEPDASGYHLGQRGPGQQVWDQASAGAQRATRACAPIIGDPVDPGAETRG